MTAAPKDERERSRSKRFVIGVWVLLGTLTVTYLYCHFCRPPAKAPELSALAGLTREGQLEIRDRSSLNWYLGSGRVASVEAAARARSDRMRRAREDIESSFGEVRRRTLQSNPAERDRFLTALSNGNYSEAYRSFERLLVSLSSETRNLLVGPGLVFTMREKLREITDYQKAQQGLLLELQPVVTSAFVWGDPDLLLLDVFFWALFGVLVHLLWSSSESFEHNRSEPERIVSLAKLLYGPVLAVGAVYALSSIFSPVLGFGLRLWLFPTIGLVLGLMSRSIVSYIDRLAERMRGRSPARAEQDAVVATAVAATTVVRQTVPRSNQEPSTQPEQAHVVTTAADVGAAAPIGEPHEETEVEQAPVVTTVPDVGAAAPVGAPVDQTYEEAEESEGIQVPEVDDEHWASADEEFDRAVEAAVESVEISVEHDPGEPLEGGFGVGEEDDDEEEPVEEPALRPAARDTRDRGLDALREAMHPRDFDELRRLAKELAELTLRARIEEGEAKV